MISTNGTAIENCSYPFFCPSKNMKIIKIYTPQSLLLCCLITFKLRLSKFRGEKAAILQGVTRLKVEGFLLEVEGFLFEVEEFLLKVEGFLLEVEGFL